MILDLFASAQPVPEKSAIRHRSITKFIVFLMLVMGFGIKTKGTKYEAKCKEKMLLQVADYKLQVVN